MNRNRLLIALLAAALLAGCGNKGPLVLPDKADAQKAKVDPHAKQPEPPAHR